MDKIDFAGVSMINTTVARGLLNTAQALRLLGSTVTLSSRVVFYLLLYFGLALAERKTEIQIK